MTERWCQWRRCEEDMNLLDEYEAVREALIRFSDLTIQGEAILINDRVEAFALGEPLNFKPRRFILRKQAGDSRTLCYDQSAVLREYLATCARH